MYLNAEVNPHRRQNFNEFTLEETKSFSIGKPKYFFNARPTLILEPLSVLGM